MVNVQIGRTVDYKIIERSLIDAAREVGWRASVQDITKKATDWDLFISK